MRVSDDRSICSESLRVICSQPYGFWLDNAEAGGRGWQPIAGHSPALVLSSRGRRIQIDRGGNLRRFEGDPLEVLRDLLAEWRGIAGGAAVGYLAYGLKQHIERLPDTAPDDLALPDCVLAFYEQVHSFDRSPLPLPAPIPHTTSDFSRFEANMTCGEYESKVLRALDYIRAGDIYQVNLAQRFRSPCREDPFDVYLRLRAGSAAPFAAFLRYPCFAVLSSSPELFLAYDETTRIVETRPIKGTRPRGFDPASDSSLAQELLASAKDRAENVMIVDLERNDLGRVAKIGSVRVTGLCELETFANVHHLTSTIRARLGEGFDVVDLLKATFPGGSITGAPKIRSMEIIDELEPVARGVYTGAIGYFGSDGSVALNIAIRTMVLKDENAYFHVGGGIVADSDPHSEYEETLHKGAAMVRALETSTP